MDRYGAECTGVKYDEHFVELIDSYSVFATPWFGKVFVHVIS